MGWNSKTWAPLKKVFSVNPNWTNGVPKPGVYRTPAPGSQPEYFGPTSEASDVAQNQYFQRDTRRNFPKLAVYTQQDVAALLAPPAVGASIASPQTEGAGTAVAATTEATETLSLASTISKHPPIYSTSNLPPLPNWGHKHEWKPSTDAPVPDDGAYFPIHQFS